MKKITLLVAFFVCAIGFSQKSANANSMGENNPVFAQQRTVQFNNAQTTTSSYEGNSSFTSEVDSDVVYLNGPAGTTTYGNTTKGVDQIITHSNTQTIEDGAEIACASPTSFRNNSMFQDYDLAGDFGVAGDFVVTAAEVAIGPVSTPSGFPMTVNIYSTTTGTFPGGTLTLQGTATQTVTNADAQSIMSFAVSATIPAGESMILEAMIVDDGTDTNFMRFGMNNDGATGPTYIMAADCGAPDPIDLAVAFGLTQTWVANVLGDEATGGGSCEQEILTNAFENGRGFNSENGWVVATDVIVADGENMDIDQLDVETWVATGQSITSADISIYDDAGGLPGSLLSTETLAPTSEVFQGTNFGWDINTVTYDLSQPTLMGQVGSTTTYWVAVQVTSSDNNSAFWGNSTADAIGNPQAFFDGSTWSIQDPTQDSVYKISGTCSPIGGGGCGGVVSEDFEAGLPAGWSAVINTGNCNWMSGQSVGTGDDFPTLAMVFDDDDACGEGSGAPASNVTLMSDVYDTNGSSSLDLSVDLAFQEAAEGGTLTVEVYDGSTWQQIDFYDSDLDPDIQTMTYDLSAYANASFQVRFTYDDGGGGWGWGAGVDNFCLDYLLGSTENTIAGFDYYPNPANETINLNAQENIESVSIFNILGQEVVSQTINATSSQINVSNLATGTYIMKVNVNGETGTYKVVKQ
ncbi:MAG: T9SS type A sorting domain-containing protein [Flavobacteriales bacterium]